MALGKNVAAQAVDSISDEANGTDPLAVDVQVNTSVDNAVDVGKAQRADPDLCSIISVMENDGVRPVWDAIAGWSSVGKALWSQWDRLEMVNGILHRVYFCVRSDVSRLQVVVPRSLCEWYVVTAHTGLGGAHLRRNRVEGAIRQRAYWVG